MRQWSKFVVMVGVMLHCALLRVTRASNVPLRQAFQQVREIQAQIEVALDKLSMQTFSMHRAAPTTEPGPTLHPSGRVEASLATLAQIESRNTAWVSLMKRKIDQLQSGQAPRPSGPDARAESTVKRRILGSDSPQCAADADATRLFVDGICSCSADVVVRNVSVGTFLSGIEAAVEEASPACDYTKFAIPTGVDNSVSVSAVRAAILSPTGDRLYMTGDVDNELVVANLTDPLHPTVVGRVSDSIALASPHFMALSPDAELVYVAAFGGQVAVVNVTNATEPHVIGRVGVQSAHGLSISPDGHTVVVASGSGSVGVVVVDVTDPMAPVELGRDNSVGGTASATVSPDGAFAYLTGYSTNNIWRVNVTDPAHPVAMNVYKDVTKIVSPYDCAISADGRYLYVASSGSLTVLDVGTDPNAAPVFAGHVTHPALSGSRYVGLVPDGSVAVVTGYVSSSVVMVSVVQPTNPSVLGSVVDSATLYGSRGLAVSLDGNYAYVAAQQASNLVVVDLWADFCS